MLLRVLACRCTKQRHSGQTEQGPLGPTVARRQPIRPCGAASVTTAAVPLGCICHFLDAVTLPADIWPHVATSMWLTTFIHNGTPRVSAATTCAKNTVLILSSGMGGIQAAVACEHTTLVGPTFLGVRRTRVCDLKCVRARFCKRQQKMPREKGLKGRMESIQSQLSSYIFQRRASKRCALSSARSLGSGLVTADTARRLVELPPSSLCHSQSSGLWSCRAEKLTFLTALSGPSHPH